MLKPHRPTAAESWITRRTAGQTAIPLYSWSPAFLFVAPRHRGLAGKRAETKFAWISSRVQRHCQSFRQQRRIRSNTYSVRNCRN